VLKVLTQTINFWRFSTAIALSQLLLSSHKNSTRPLWQHLGLHSSISRRRMNAGILSRPPFIASWPEGGGPDFYHCENSHSSGNLPKQILAISTMVRGGWPNCLILKAWTMDTFPIHILKWPFNSVILRRFGLCHFSASNSHLVGRRVNFAQLWEHIAFQP